MSEPRTVPPMATRPSRREALITLAAALGGGAWSAAGEAPLRTRPIPSSGRQLPIVGLGTWQVLDVGPHESERAPVRALLARLVASGGQVVDTSPMYGEAEQVLGDLSVELGVRDRLFVATKVWTSGRRAGIAQMERSVVRLGGRAIDLMQVHNLIDVDVHLETLAEWKRAGKVHHVGVTHYLASAHRELAALVRRGGVDAVQVNYSIAEREAERELLALAAASGVAVVVNRPFAGGAALRRVGSVPLADWLAARGVASWPQAMLIWTLSHPAVTCAIPATSKLRHLEENLAAAAGWLPDPDERRRLTRDLERVMS